VSYATQQDMIDRFGEREVIALSDRDDNGVIDVPVLAAGLVAADNEINAYLAGAYSLPLSITLPIVRDFACDIARYRLSSGEVVETEEVRNRYRDAIKFFEKVAAGKISLGVSLLNQQTSMVGSVKSSTPNRVFNADSLRDFNRAYK